MDGDTPYAGGCKPADVKGKRVVVGNSARDDQSSLLGSGRHDTWAVGVRKECEARGEQHR